MKMQCLEKARRMQRAVRGNCKACLRRLLPRLLPVSFGVGLALYVFAGTTGKIVNASAGDDAKAVVALDTEYQAAVKINDAATMDRLLADDYILVVGSGKVYTKADLVNEARGGHVVYEHQEDTEQTARIWGDTAVITAKLWVKGSEDGKPFDKTVWFSDTYVRTKAGWRYVFGQSSLALPKTP